MQRNSINWPIAALVLALCGSAHAADERDAATTTARALHWLQQSDWVLEGGSQLDAGLTTRIARTTEAIRSENFDSRELGTVSLGAGDRRAQLRGVSIATPDVDIHVLRAYRDAQVEVHRALRRLESDPKDALLAAGEALEILHALNGVKQGDALRTLPALTPPDLSDLADLVSDNHQGGQR